MKRALSVMALVTVVALGVLSLSQVAFAEETKMVGVVNRIELAKDGKSAMVTLKDNKTEENVQILVTDELTLDKFKDHRIVEGDEIRCKFEPVDGKNNSKLFRKTAGC
jgi:hypothetical protein